MGSVTKNKGRGKNKSQNFLGVFITSFFNSALCTRTLNFRNLGSQNRAAGFRINTRVFHKLDEIGNNANIDIRKQSSDKILPPVGIELALISSPILSFLH